MNPIYRFYQAVLRTLNKREWSEKDVERVRKFAASTPGLSPHFKDEKVLTEVFDDDDDEIPLCDTFMAAASKDLLSLKTLASKRLLSGIRKRLEYETYGAFFFASDIKREKDGSATIVLNVNDLDKFEKLMNATDNIKGSLASGAIIHET